MYILNIILYPKNQPTACTTTHCSIPLKRMPRLVAEAIQLLHVLQFVAGKSTVTPRQRLAMARRISGHVYNGVMMSILGQKQN